MAAASAADPQDGQRQEELIAETATLKLHLKLVGLMHWDPIKVLV